MTTPTPAEIAAAVQAADDLASVAAGQLTDAQALAAKDAQILTRDNLIASLQAKISAGKASASTTVQDAQATLTALS